MIVKRPVPNCIFIGAFALLLVAAAFLAEATAVMLSSLSIVKIVTSWSLLFTGFPGVHDIHHSGSGRKQMNSAAFARGDGNAMEGPTPIADQRVW